MAEKNVDVPPNPPTINFNIPNIPPGYVNVWNVQLGETEVTLTLGTGGITDGKSVLLNPVSSVALSHGQFIRFAYALERVAVTIKKLYGGPLPTIQDFTQERMQAALAEADKELKG